MVRCSAKACGQKVYFVSFMAKIVLHLYLNLCYSRSLFLTMRYHILYCLSWPRLSEPVTNAHRKSGHREQAWTAVLEVLLRLQSPIGLSLQTVWEMEAQLWLHAVMRWADEMVKRRLRVRVNRSILGHFNRHTRVQGPHAGLSYLYNYNRQDKILGRYRLGRGGGKTHFATLMMSSCPSNGGILCSSAWLCHVLIFRPQQCLMLMTYAGRNKKCISSSSCVWTMSHELSHCLHAMKSWLVLLQDDFYLREQDEMQDA